MQHSVVPGVLTNVQKPCSITNSDPLSAFNKWLPHNQFLWSVHCANFPQSTEDVSRRTMPKSNSWHPQNEGLKKHTWCWAASGGKSGRDSVPTAVTRFAKASNGTLSHTTIPCLKYPLHQYMPLCNKLTWHYMIKYGVDSKRLPRLSDMIQWMCQSLANQVINSADENRATTKPEGFFHQINLTSNNPKDPVNR